jgi:hypothetical protein
MSTSRGDKRNAEAAGAMGEVGRMVILVGLPPGLTPVSPKHVAR